MKYKFKLVDIVLVMMVTVIIDDFKAGVFIDILLDMLIFTPALVVRLREIKYNK